MFEVESKVREALSNVIDPEVEINIVDLGLIYEIFHDENANSIEVEMTLSARGCPVGDVIVNQAAEVIREAFPDKTVNVELVWEPQWTPDRITPEGKAKLMM